MSTDLIQIEHEVSPVVLEAQAIVVVDEEGKKMASEVLSKLNRYNDAVVEDREKITKPINEALKEVRAKYKPLERQLEEAIDVVRGKIGGYQTMMVQKQKKEEVSIASRIGEGKGKLKLDTAVRKMDEIEKPLQSVVTVSGGVKFRTDKILKVVDASLIPLGYYDLNESRVTKDLKAGVLVVGCELEEVQTVINNRG